jgi:hypothetical protein
VLVDESELKTAFIQLATRHERGAPLQQAIVKLQKI